MLCLDLPVLMWYKISAEVSVHIHLEPTGWVLSYDDSLVPGMIQVPTLPFECFAMGLLRVGAESCHLVCGVGNIWSGGVFKKI